VGGTEANILTIRVMVSLVIPALDEQDEIGNAVSSAAAVLRSAGIAPFEIIVIDDSSTDATAERARAAGARVITHVQNLGYGRSLKDGITAAQHDCIIISDADGTYPLKEMPALIARYRCGFAMVVGARSGEHYRQSLLKSPMRKLLQLLVQFTAGRSIPDINSGFRIFSRATIMPYFNHLCNTFSFTTSATLAYMMRRRTVAYMPIGYDQRIGESKVHLFRDSLRTLQYIVEAIVYYNPLKIFIMCSFGCLLLAAVIAVFAILFHVATLFMLSAGTVLVAILIFSLGLLAVLLKQIMDK
jgi:polyisoprenyl-phosphate glycosyltransferase